ncbi:MAG TPA: hypothetical protein ENN43_08930 [bacterium]|nr:hypothetical protein [bacterium]
MKKNLVLVLAGIIIVAVLSFACDNRKVIELTAADIGSGGGGPAPVNTAINTPTVTPTTEAAGFDVVGIFDDMEDNDNENNWGGFWYTYDDYAASTPPGSSYVVPWTDGQWERNGMAAEPFFMTAVTDRPGSSYAARMTGVVTTDFTYGFVGMGCSFLDPKAPVDVWTGVTGVRFWTKGDYNGYRMKIMSSSPLFLDGEGDNHFGYAFIAPPDWTQLTIPYSNFTQEPYWGTVVTDKEAALKMGTDIQFQTVGQPHASIELWVDHIEFY